MMTTFRRVPTWFAPETRFHLDPGPPRPNRAVQDAALDELKNRLLAERMAEVQEPPLAPALRRAADEAAALAWLTPYPLLVLPGLLDEKAAEARRHARKQSVVRRRTQLMIEEAA